MKALFYLLSIAVILGAAYFSYDNKAKLEEQQTIREEAEAQDKRIVASTTAEETKLKAEKERLTNAQMELAEVEASISKLEADQRTVANELKAVEAKLAEQQATIAAAEQAFVDAKNLLNQLNIDVDGEVTIENITEIIQGLEDDKKALIAEIGEIEEIISSAEKAVSAGREEVDRNARKIAERASKVRANSMTSVVTAVDQNWGFVVIGAGRNQGFTPQRRLIIERDGRRIAEVKPSSVEASQTIAEIDYDTITPGVVIQPGDRVIFASARN